jgi:NAD-dependent dihydropyrimidine dehydrogenase PreA subunit
LSIMPVFDATRCDGCGQCISVCRCGALVLTGNMVTIVEVDNCGWCTDCELVCPTGAIQCPFEIVTTEE